MLEKFILVSETHFQNTETTLKNQQASIQGLKTQIGQLAKLVFERPQGFQQQPYQQEKNLNLEEMLEKFILVSETHFQNTETTLKNQQASIQGLKTQIGQLAKLVFERPQGSLPSNTEPNPKEHVKAVT
ncbi:hypothetical protein GOBAR_AA16315 [Gossypium barbadense]|uniref:DUF641 domain-containing protein n=1 Tax=Gossypium barbadense TaxID=3634 RepID=A0A2P5XLX4_GOSBA|nr:hypothetical protein GOBAR_AA16315 [Gossypium barbadense]